MLLGDTRRLKLVLLFIYLEIDVAGRHLFLSFCIRNGESKEKVSQSIREITQGTVLCLTAIVIQPKIRASGPI